MILPPYLQKAVDCGLADFNEETGNIVFDNFEIEKAANVARIVDKLQPTSLYQKEDTVSQEAIVLSRIVTERSTISRDLWSKLRVALGVPSTQKIPKELFSEPVFKAIAKEIDYTFLGERPNRVISRESLITGYTNLHHRSRTTSIQEFAQTVTELSDEELLQKYGEVDFEWDTALDILKAVRIRSILKDTLHSIKQCIVVDAKIEETLELMQSKSMICIGLMTGEVGNQGHFVSLVNSIIGDPGDGTKNIIDRLLAPSEIQQRPASTGIAAIDVDINGGVSRPMQHQAIGGRMHVFAARTGTGKTAVACSVAANLRMQGLTVGYVSAELSRDQINNRILSSISRNMFNIHFAGTVDQPGYFKRAELERPDNDPAIRERLAKSVMAVTDKLMADPAKILIESPFNPTVHAVVNSMRGMKAQQPELRAVIIDHFHIISKHKGSPHNLVEALEERAHILIHAAKELDIDIFLFAQCNQNDIKQRRIAIKGENRPPEMDEIRGTDALSHLGHAIWIMRKQQLTEDQINSGLQPSLEIWHMKARDGQYHWCGIAPNERMVNLENFIEKSIVKLEYSTCKVTEDSTNSDPQITNLERK